MRRVLNAAAVIAVAVYFVVFAADGLHAYFTLDDGGNLLNAHGYWEHSLGEMAGSRGSALVARRSRFSIKRAFTPGAGPLAGQPPPTG